MTNKKIVLLRHGQSIWNLENRFTGWTDVDLTAQGISEAKEAGKLLKKEGFQFEIAYTSYLKRAIKTLNFLLEEMNLDWLPVYKNWHLNEKHYGALQGLNKQQTAQKYGEEQVKIWRRSYNVSPPALLPDDPRAPSLDPRYWGIPTHLLPLTESLKDTVKRVIPFWQTEIVSKLRSQDQLLIVAHGNSLRAILKHVKQISDEQIVHLNLPTGIPYVLELDSQGNLQKDYFLGKEAEIKEKIKLVENQGKSTL
jgi:2,3-bisphosphoglycerate-dependent phosphoglycerate mutase